MSTGKMVNDPILIYLEKRTEKLEDDLNALKSKKSKIDYEIERKENELEGITNTILNRKQELNIETDGVNIEIPDDMFARLSFPKAINKLLFTYKRVHTTSEIKDALLKGGMEKTDNFDSTLKATLYKVRSSGKIDLVGDKRWKIKE